MKKDFQTANIDRFRSADVNVTSALPSSLAKEAHVAEKSPSRQREELPEQKPPIIESETVSRPKTDKIAPKKRPAREVPTVDAMPAPSHYYLTVMTDRHTYDELCIHLKEHGKSIRSGLRESIAELIEKQGKEAIEQAAIAARSELKEDTYKTSVQIPYELYLDVFRFCKRKHLKLLQIVDAAIAMIISSS